MNTTPTTPPWLPTPAKIEKEQRYHEKFNTLEKINDRLTVLAMMDGHDKTGVHSGKMQRRRERVILEGKKEQILNPELFA